MRGMMAMFGPNAWYTKIEVGAVFASDETVLRQYFGQSAETCDEEEEQHTSHAGVACAG